MNNIEHNDNVAQDQQSINITPEQLETLFQQFVARLKTEEKGRGERTILPYQIMAEMDETPSPEMRTTIKKYAREVPLYEGGNWPASETTNKIFIPDLKRHKVDAHQVVSQRYKDADHLRIAARAATEVFEDLTYVQENGSDNAVLMDIIEKTRRLAIYSYITANSIDKEARDLSTTALRLPSNMRYIQEEEESNKNWHSLQSLSKKFNKLVMNSKSFEAPSNIDRMDLEDEEASEVAFPTINEEISSVQKLFWQRQRENQPATGDKLQPNPIQPIIKTSTVLQTPSYPIAPIMKSQKIQGHYEVLSDGTLPGGRLENFVDNWKTMIQHPWPISVVSEGYRIQWASNPVPWKPKMMIFSKDDQVAVDTAVQKFLKAGIIERSPTQSKQFLSNFFTIQKTSDSGLSETESIRTMSTLQNGRNTGLKKHHRRRRPYGKVRFKGRICGRTNARKVKTISIVSSQRNRLPVSFTGLRAERSSKSLLEADALCSGTAQKTRDTLSLLSRRYLSLSQVDERDEKDNQSDNQPFNIPGFLDQLGKERTNSIKNTRIPGIQFQYRNNENQGSSGKNEQNHSTLQTSYEDNHNPVMPLDSKSNRENDFRNPSNRRSSFTCSTPSKRSYEESENERLQELGSTLCPVNAQPTRLTMVGKMVDGQKWPAYSCDTPGNPHAQTDNPCGCPQHGLGSEVKRNGNLGILDRRRKKNFHQRERTSNNLFCFETARKKRKKFHNSHILRQQNSIELCNESRRDSIIPTSITCNSDTRYHKQVQFDSNIQPYSGNQEYTSRPIESTSNPALRMETTKEMVQENNSQMGSPFNRCICDETKQASENVLELDAGSGGSGDECIQSDLAFEGSISEPALEINPQGIALLQETKNTRSNTGNTTMDDSILVPNGITDDEGPTNSNETKQEVVSSRLEAIQKGQDQMKFDKTVTKFLNNKIRKRTTQAYNLGWQRWERWCNSQIPPVDPLVYNIKNLVEFFVSFQHMSIQQLKGQPTLK
ncbi:hypothetical protein RO3G_04697 [Rhizopus delemar RA 99-880]|uniref:Uncharacterized protein n=1 Tax=Rhizopus delemar (strain RA 99-880 / ATCC MYA-4621 / FGSC 9543 / NRRL 43880) TaxID=246409 RepID=I1BUW2_RHIO9|nr:hypothetical protein RO3G_04697 [Rhizopus delemar RA 99-880]|eukprot:EIE79992.1 hypothetical protein RO3G_04697 [Rhizopus delemar RA 99-880]